MIFREYTRDCVPEYAKKRTLYTLISHSYRRHSLDRPVNENSSNRPEHMRNRDEKRRSGIESGVERNRRRRKRRRERKKKSFYCLDASDRRVQERQRRLASSNFVSPSLLPLAHRRERRRGLKISLQGLEWKKKKKDHIYRKRWQFIRVDVFVDTHYHAKYNMLTTSHNAKRRVAFDALARCVTDVNAERIARARVMRASCYFLFLIFFYHLSFFSFVFLVSRRMERNARSLKILLLLSWYCLGMLEGRIVRFSDEQRCFRIAW